MRVVSIVLSLIVLGSAARLAAQDQEQCVQAYEEAQSLQLEHRLIEARERLITCTNELCPRAISADCFRWLSQVESTTPTVVLAAQNQAGEDLVEATFSIDGRPLTGGTGGQAIAIDPGPHAFRAEAPGFLPSEQKAVVREGEKARLVALALRPAPKELAVSEHEGSAARPARLRLASYVLFGVGAAALGAGTYVGYVGYHDGKELRDTCKPGCDPVDVDAARAKLIVGHVALGIGAAALATGIVTLVLGTRMGSESAPPHAREATGVDVALGPGSALLRLRTRF